MNPLIDERYFWGITEISSLKQVNSAAPGSASSEKANKLSRYIGKYQDEFILKCFGSLDLDSQYIDMLYDETTAISPIANYVYVMFKMENMSFATASGQKKLTTPNTIIVDERPQIVAAWNDMVDQIQRIHNTIYKTSSSFYENNILKNLDNSIRYVTSNNRETGIILSGGIFSKKSMYDFFKQ